MGADPIAMCGNCREIVAGFHLSKCVDCINERYSIDINDKRDRVLTNDLKVNKEWRPHCYDDILCEGLEDLEKCIKQGHKVLIDPSW
jgi:hypothetical protein